MSNKCFIFLLLQKSEKLLFQTWVPMNLIKHDRQAVANEKCHKKMSITSALPFNDKAFREDVLDIAVTIP